MTLCAEIALYYPSVISLNELLLHYFQYLNFPPTSTNFSTSTTTVYTHLHK